jgi:F-type H+-transporting ATPase subunit d
MAARRVSKTAVEWTAFSEIIAPSKRESFRKFISLNDKFLGGVHQYPEQIPIITFIL